MPVNLRFFKRVCELAPVAVSDVNIRSFKRTILYVNLRSLMCM